MDELKQCPICGKSDFYIGGFFSSPDLFLRCECGVEFTVYVPWKKNESEKSHNKRGYKKLVEAWNTRTQPENKPLTLEQLKQMDGNPVWVEFINPVGDIKSSWFLVSNDYSFKITNSETYELYPDEEDEDWYGIDYVAYVHKPEANK